MLQMLTSKKNFPKIKEDTTAESSTGMYVVEAETGHLKKTFPPIMMTQECGPIEISRDLLTQ